MPPTLCKPRATASKKKGPEGPVSGCNAVGYLLLPEPLPLELGELGEVVLLPLELGELGEVVLLPLLLGELLLGDELLLPEAPPLAAPPELAPELDLLKYASHS